MLEYFAATDPSTGITNYLFTQGVLGVVCVGLIIVIVYLAKRSDKKDDEIKALNALLLSENKTHTADYKEMAEKNQEVLQGNSQNMALFGEKIEVAKGRR